MSQQPTKRQFVGELYRLVDAKQPEAKWAIGVSALLEIFFFCLSLYSNFTVLADEICSLFQCIIAGLISLIGVAVSGIAIVIALFTTEQMQAIEKARKGTLDTLLYDFQWLAIVSTVEVAIFTALIFLIRTPSPIIPKLPFYFLTFVLTYGVFYLLFYCCALIGNFIKMASIKRSLDEIASQSKNLPILAIEFQLDFLVSRIIKDKDTAQIYHRELLEHAKQSSLREKDDLVKYLEHRYLDSKND